MGSRLRQMDTGRSTYFGRLMIVVLGACLAFAISNAQASASTAHLNINYDLDSPAAPPSNLLDLYTPDGAKPGDGRPLVVFVHGGGWRIGDKANKIADKVKLFTDLGYDFASVNYRLSPATGNPENPDPNRIKFPAHPHDVGEAVGWLDRHVAEYGGDPTRMILIGHSAGAQIVSLVSTDPSYVEAYGVEPWQIIGTVPLDSDAFDITQQATQVGNDENRDLFWNAFATPAENEVSGAWLQASATYWASPKDPEFLLVTSQNPKRLQQNQIMAEALDQDPDDILSLPYSHEMINEALGSSNDPAGETPVVTSFVAQSIAASADAKAKLAQHPAEHSHLDQGEKKKTVHFGFTSKTTKASFKCRLAGAEFKTCHSVKKLAVDQGNHYFHVQPFSQLGRPGIIKTFHFRVSRSH